MLKRNLSYVVFLLVMITSCAPVYMPPTAHAPLLKEQGDFQMATHWGTGGFDLQMAYAFTDHFGFRTAGSFKPGLNEKRNRHLYGEAGLGLFTTFAERGVFEGYAGAGIGRGEGFSEWILFDETQTRNTKANYFRPFVQTNIGLSLSHLELGFSNTFALLNVYNYERDQVLHTGVMRDLYIEPSFFFRAGTDLVKFQLTTGLSLPLTEVDGYSWIPWQASLGVNLGLNFRN